MKRIIKTLAIVAVIACMCVGTAYADDANSSVLGAASMDNILDLGFSDEDMSVAMAVPAQADENNAVVAEVPEDAEADLSAPADATAAPMPEDDAELTAEDGDAADAEVVNNQDEEQADEESIVDHVAEKASRTRWIIGGGVIVVLAAAVLVLGEVKAKKAKKSGN